jgi:excisionase family DNA binding protein
MACRVRPRFEEDLGAVAFLPIPRFYTVSEVAAIFRLSIRSVRRLIADQKLSTVRIGRAIRVPEEAVRALIEKK